MTVIDVRALPCVSQQGERSQCLTPSLAPFSEGLCQVAYHVDTCVQIQRPGLLLPRVSHSRGDSING
jgi:hypothetical protein